MFIPETATELIGGGVAPWTLETNADYQLCQIKLQIAKEKVFYEAAQKLFDAEKVLIIKEVTEDEEYKNASLARI